MLIYTPAATAKTIPVIDLKGSFSELLEDRKAVAWEVHKACRDTGFFYIKNHGVSSAIMQGQLDVARRFFGRPLEEKLQIDARNSECMRGYEAMAIQVLDDGSQPDLKEGFMAGRDLGSDHPYVVQKVPYHGSNQWLADDQAMREATEQYVETMRALGIHLAGILALSLDLPESYFETGVDEAMVTTRFLHYPPQTDVGEGNQLGAGAHTDWGLLTILMQDDVGGLEVQNADGDWVNAPPIPDTFVINLGDMVPVLTNGLYHSNMHRVYNKSPERHRYSVPTFFDLDYFYRIKAVPTVEAVAGSEEVTVGEHIANMYRKTYALQEGSDA